MPLVGNICLIINPLKSRYFFFLYTFLLTYLVRDNPFFWDTVQLGSKHATFYYDNHFADLLLPTEIDSGHLPAFGMYLALCWMLFGKTLAVSHFAMLPFLWGIVWQSYCIGAYLKSEKEAWKLVALLLACPIVAGQSVLMSPDVPLLFFFLLGLRSVWEGGFYRKNIEYRTRNIEYPSTETRKFGLKTFFTRFFTSILDIRHSIFDIQKPILWLSFATLGLVATSMRGMMLVVFLFLYDVLITYYVGIFRMNWKPIFKKAIAYVPSGILALAFLSWHYWRAGWIGYHDGSAWASSFEKVTFFEFIKNTIIFGWRLLDYGMVFVWLSIGYSIWKFKSRNSPADSAIQANPGIALIRLVIGLVLLFLVLSPTLLLHKGLLLHRYLLPFYVWMIFLCYHLLESWQVAALKKGGQVCGWRLAALWNNGMASTQPTANRKPQTITQPTANCKPQTTIQPTANRKPANLFYLLLLLLVTGNFWKYPNHIAQGWDATLGHLPYYSLRAKMVDYINEKHYDYNAIGSAFPNLSDRHFIDLDPMEGKKMLEKNLFSQQHIFYSNIYNDFSDNELDSLKQHWIVEKKFSKLGIDVVLYRHP
ncbi:MAG: hypothetical protein RLZZ292_768 [Bacteroidota bacterium]